MYPSTHPLHIISPTRSTPSLVNDELECYSPPDDYLATPDLSEWKEIRRLEDEKLRLESNNQEDAHLQFDLPSLHSLTQNQRPLSSELPPQLPPWPHATISPKDAFPDYFEVCRFLQEQARPSSPSAVSSASSIYDDNEFAHNDNLSCNVGSYHHSPSCEPQAIASPPVPSPANIHPSTASHRRVGKKAKREDEDEYTPAPKRRITAANFTISRGNQSDLEDDEDGSEVNDIDLVDDPVDEDESGDFRPVRRPPQSRRKSSSNHSRASARPAAALARPRAPAARRSVTHPKTKSNRGEDYQTGPCECRNDKCTNCQMTCFYVFVHGDRKGEVCRRLFESGRHLDLKRHKATHAVQEWKWLQDGEITSDMAHWYSDVFEGKEHGLMCPNGECMTTFTRYDALKRHMERGTCGYASLESDKDGLDNRQVKAKIIRESDEKYQRISAARAAHADNTTHA